MNMEKVKLSQRDKINSQEWDAWFSTNEEMGPNKIAIEVLENEIVKAKRNQSIYNIELNRCLKIIVENPSSPNQAYISRLKSVVFMNQRRMDALEEIILNIKDTLEVLKG